MRYEITVKPLWNHNEFNIFFTISPKIHHFFAISLSVPRIYLESTILFAESRWIYYPFLFITVNTLFASRFYYKSIIYFAIFPRIHYLLWIHFIFREFTISFAISLWIQYLIPEITMNVLFSAKSIWIHYRLRDFTMNSLFEFTIWIHNLILFSL